MWPPPLKVMAFVSLAMDSTSPARRVRASVSKGLKKERRNKVSEKIGRNPLEGWSSGFVTISGKRRTFRLCGLHLLARGVQAVHVSLRRATSS